MHESEDLECNKEVVKILRKVPPLKFFHKEDFDGFITLSKIRRYNPGECIMAEGEQDSWIYFLISGEVRVTKKEKELSVIKNTGEIFGEMAVIDGAPRSASVHAVTEATCLASDVSYIDRLSGNEKFRFGYFLYNILARVIVNRLRAYSEILTKKEISESRETEFQLNSGIFVPDLLENIPPDLPNTEPDQGKDDDAADPSEECVILKSDLGELKITNGDIIGRKATGKNLFKAGSQISREHARVFYFNNTWYIEDLKSKNGTYLNGERLLPLNLYRISEEDKITLPVEKDNNSTFTVEII